MLEDQNISIKRKPGYDISNKEKKRESEEGKIQYKKNRSCTNEHK